MIRPSLPTTLAIRAVSRVSFSSRSATSLNASAIAAPTTLSSTGRRTLKSPFLRVFSAASSLLESKCSFVEGATGVRAAASGRCTIPGVRSRPLCHRTASTEARTLTRWESRAAPRGPPPTKKLCKLVITFGHATTHRTAAPIPELALRKIRSGIPDRHSA